MGLRSVAIAIWTLAACAAVAFLYFAASILLPLVIAVFLFYALDPVVDRVQGLKVPRILASVVVVLALLGALGVGAAVLWPQFEAVVSKVPKGVEQLRSRIQDVRGESGGVSALKKVQAAAKAIDRATVETADPPVSPPGTLRVEVAAPWRASDWLWTGGLGALGLLGQGVTVLFLTVFLLDENDSFKRKLVSRMETLGRKRLTVQILDDIARQIERFIWVQVLTSAGVAVVTGLALWWLGVEQAAVWGLFAGLLNLVPYFGPLIVTVVLMGVGFLQFGTLTDAVKVGGLALAITVLEGNFITPHLLSRAAALNPVTIFVAIAFWSGVWGVPGTLLAVPLLMAVKAVCDHVDGLEAIGEFLGE